MTRSTRRVILACVLALFAVSATPVAAGANADEPDLGAASTGAISGTVTDGTNPLAGATVEVWTTEFDYAGWAVTELDGTYLVEELAPGDYMVEFGYTDFDTFWSGIVFYNGAMSWDEATPVTVVAGQTTSGIDATFDVNADPLPDGGAIAGTVRDINSAPLPGVDVAVYDSSWSFVGSAQTSSSGVYQVEGLEPGDHFVHFSYFHPQTWDFYEQYYDGAADSSGATPVMVTAMETTAGIDGQLDVERPEPADVIDPREWAEAVAVDPEIVVGASWETIADPLAAAVRTTPAGGLPRAGDSYGVLSSGDVAAFDFESTTEDLGGGNHRGDTDYDVTILAIDLDIPEGRNCVSFDFRFYSREYPTFVGTQYNDAFIAELGTSTWTTSGSQIIAPDNFAFDPAGNPITINAAGVTSMNNPNADGTSFGGATPLLVASSPVTPGLHTLHLSIFDQGDHILDSAVIVDNLRAHTTEGSEACASGANTVNGLLRVTSTPALPTTISVNGFAQNDWGLDWVSVPIGTHEVCFGDVPGFATPECETVTVAENQTTTVNGQFDPLGALQVQVSPAGLPATIYVDGEPRNEYGMYSFTTPGTYQVCWGAVPGWGAPACENVDVDPGATTTITGTYTEGASGGIDPGIHGYLRVTSNPAVATTISVNGIARNDWGLDWVKFPVGFHQVCFSGVVGFATPECQFIEITEGETTVVEGTFEQYGLLQVQVNPAGLPTNITIDGFPANQFGAFAWRTPGTYLVCWTPVGGYTTPACQQATVDPGQLTTITGTFTAN